jgi:hypothetical protein
VQTGADPEVGGTSGGAAACDGEPPAKRQLSDVACVSAAAEAPLTAAATAATAPTAGGAPPPSDSGAGNAVEEAEPKGVPGGKSCGRRFDYSLEPAMYAASHRAFPPPFAEGRRSYCLDCAVAHEAARTESEREKITPNNCRCTLKHTGPDWCEVSATDTLWGADAECTFSWHT